MAKYTPKTSRERGEKFETSWQENAPDRKLSEGSLADFKAKRQIIYPLGIGLRKSNHAKVAG